MFNIVQHSLRNTVRQWKYTNCSLCWNVQYCWNPVGVT